MAIAEKELLAKGNPAQMVFEVKVKNGDVLVAENLFYFHEVKALKLEKPLIEKSIKKMGDNKYVVSLKCGTLVKNVALNTISEGRFSNNYFDMLPGKTYTLDFLGDLSCELEIKTIVDSF